jgi:hypothetical protein
MRSYEEILRELKIAQATCDSLEEELRELRKQCEHKTVKDAHTRYAKCLDCGDNVGYILEIGDREYNDDYPLESKI